jgi:hypothetical protein
VPDLPPSDLAGTAMARKVTADRQKESDEKEKDKIFINSLKNFFSLTGSTVYAGSRDSFDKVVFLFVERIFSNFSYENKYILKLSKILNFLLR